MSIDPEKIRQKLPQTSIIFQLEEAQFLSACKMMKVREYSKGTMIFSRGGFPAHLHLMLEGGAKSVCETEEGRETVLHMIEPGDLFSLVSSYLNIEYTGTAITTRRSLVGVLKRDQLLELLEGSSILSKELTTTLANKVRQLLLRVEEQTMLPPRERVIRYLQGIRVEQGTNQIYLPFFKADTSHLLGMAPETFSRVLSELEHAGSICLQGRTIELLDPSLWESPSDR